MKKKFTLLLAAFMLLMVSGHSSGHIPWMVIPRQVTMS